MSPNRLGSRGAEQKFQRVTDSGGAAPGVFNLEVVGGRRFVVTTEKSGEVLRSELDVRQGIDISISDHVPTIGVLGGRSYLVRRKMKLVEAQILAGAISSGGATGLEVDILWQKAGWAAPGAGLTIFSNTIILQGVRNSGVIPGVAATLVVTDFNPGDLLLFYVKSDDGSTTKAKNVQAFLLLE